MTPAAERLRHAVDEVLERAWPTERRRAARRLRYHAVARIVGGSLALWSLGFGVHLLVGVSFPWLPFGLVALLATIAASHQDDPVHLRRD